MTADTKKARGDRPPQPAESGAGGESIPAPQSECLPDRGDKGTAAPAKLRRRRRESRRTAALRKGQIDLGALIEEPIAVLKNGKSVKMDPIEAAMRRQVQKALKDKSLPSIKEVIDLAIKYGLVSDPPTPAKGGVLEIPKSMSQAEQKFIFSHPGPSNEQILSLLERHYAECEQV